MENLDFVKIGDRIRKRRESLALSQEEAAEMLGFTQSKVSRLECGVGLHNLYNLLDLSDAYDVPLKELIFGKDVKESSAMRKEQSKIIEKAGKHGFPENMMNELAREDLSIRQLMKLYTAFYWICNKEETEDDSITGLVPDIISAIESRDNEKYYELLDRIVPKRTTCEDDDSLYREICKIKTLLPGEGVFVVDAAVWFPYTNKEDLHIEAILWGIGIFAGFDHYVNSEEEGKTVINRRYANKAYATLSSKNGRKICDAGCPLIRPIDDLNGYAFLEIDLSFDGSNLAFLLPVTLSLSEELPLSQLTFRLCFTEDEVVPPGITVIVNGDVYDTRKVSDESYSDFFKPLYAQLTSTDGWEAILLSPVDEKMNIVEAVCKDECCFAPAAEKLT